MDASEPRPGVARLDSVNPAHAAPSRRPTHSHVPPLEYSTVAPSVNPVPTMVTVVPPVVGSGDAAGVTDVTVTASLAVGRAVIASARATACSTRRGGRADAPPSCLADELAAMAR